VRTDLFQSCGLNVSRETIDRLEALLAVMVKWNAKINLVSRSSLTDAWSRHIVDSAQIYGLAPENTKNWADLGSGGGFPGLVIAAIAVELNPDLCVTLVEADQRKATFLRQASQELALNTKVMSDRIENIEPLRAEVLSARALAPLDMLCGFVARHLAPNGAALFPKGETYTQEIQAAQLNWRFEASIKISVTEPKAVILKLKDLTHV
jgi:16S rRNA (guanine527-N7)-methyltransferase